MPAKNRKKSTAKQASAYQLTRSGLFGWSIVVIVGATLMFVLGILVGRGQIEYPAAAGSLQQELIRNKQIAKEAQRAAVKQHLQGGDAQQPLEFHEGVRAKQKPRPLSPPPSKPAKPAPKQIKPTPQPKADRRPPQKAAPAPPKTQKSRRYTIQVASVKDSQTAQELVQTLREMGFGDAYRVTGTIPGRGTWHRVRVGHYATKTEAQKTLSRLKPHKLNGFMISE